MKTTQWVIAYGVLVVLFFGIVFIVNYTGDTSGSGGGVRSEAPSIDYKQLLFPIKSTTPDPGRFVIESEKGAEGQADFWFFNPNEVIVPVGLNRVACKCSSVEIWLAPPEVRQERAAEAAGHIGEVLSGGPFSILTRIGVTEHAERAQSFESRCEMRRLETAASPVPVGALGWVRIKWKNKESGRQKLDAQLWYHHAELGPKVSLEAYANFHEPYSMGAVDSLNKVTREMKLAETSVERLPLSEDLFVWSYTRKALDLVVKNVQLGRRIASDGFVIEKPVPLSREETARLQGKLAGVYDGSPISCAYRVRYRVNSRTADDKGWFDQGIFSRRVAVSLADEIGEPLELTIEGSLRGDVRVTGGRESLDIDLQTFETTVGSRTETRTILTERPNLDLEIDRTRTSPFLKVVLEAPEPTAAGGKTWLLRVRVEASKARGRFPRLDDPDYQDAAIYLRPVGGEGRALRIPVRGTATQ